MNNKRNRKDISNSFFGQGLVFCIVFVLFFISIYFMSNMNTEERVKNNIRQGSAPKMNYNIDSSLTIPTTSNIFDFEVEDINSNSISLKKFQDNLIKAYLIVNVASK